MHETMAVCEPDGGLITWKIKVRIVAVVLESVPGTKVPLTLPRLAVMLVALFALMVTMIIAVRLVRLPIMNAGVVARKPELVLLSYAAAAAYTCHSPPSAWGTGWGRAIRAGKASSAPSLHRTAISDRCRITLR
jgi:hypothetical protein